MDTQFLNVARSKIARFCSYRERAAKEVKNKLKSFELDERHIEMIMSELVEEGFLDDERFAKTYASSKFRLKKWGKLKIKRELRLKGIDEEHIKTGLAEIEGQSYLETLEHLANQKFDALKIDNLFVRKQKVGSYLVSKGYESDLVWETLNKLQ